MSTQSFVIVGRPFAEVSDHSQIMKEMYYETKGVRISVFYIRVVSIGVVVTLSSKVVVLRIGTLYVNCISIRVV